MSSISDDSPPQAENFRGLLFEMLEKIVFLVLALVHGTSLSRFLS